MDVVKQMCQNKGRTDCVFLVHNEFCLGLSCCNILSKDSTDNIWVDVFGVEDDRRGSYQSGSVKYKNNK